MNCRYMLILFFALCATSVSGENLNGADDATIVSRLVEKFQKVPAPYMYCSVTGGEQAGAPEVILPQFSGYLSHEFLKLFSWIQCEQPNQPRPLRNERSYSWDFRYGLSITVSGDSNYPAKNIRVFPPLFQSKKMAMVKVAYNYYQAEKNLLSTTYTLIIENGQWKIDDIALSGYEIDMGTEGKEWVLPRSQSLKTELQSAYKRAEAKCLQTQTCKAKLGK